MLAGRRQDRLEALAQEIQEAGGQALAVQCDVTRDGELEQAVSRAREAFGGVDVVVANVGRPLKAKVARIVADKGLKQIRGYDAAGALVVAYPATIGSSLRVLRLAMCSLEYTSCS